MPVVCWFLRLLNEQDFSTLTVKKAKAHSSVAAIELALRTVNNPVFTELCTQEHPGLRAVRNQERSPLRLLQTHVRNRVSHARTSSDEVTHGTAHDAPVDENSGMDEYTEQGEQRVWTDAEGHVLHRMQVNEDCTWDPLYEKYEQNRLKRMSRRGAYRYTSKRKEGQPSMHLDTKEAFIDWMTKHSTYHNIITPLYDRFDRATNVLASQWCKGQKQFLVQWAPTPCRVRHIPLHVELGYKVHCTAPYTGNQLDDAGEETNLVTWEPKWEAADSFCHPDHPEQIKLAA